MKIINKTPHPVTILDIDNNVVNEFLPEGDRMRNDLLFPYDIVRDESGTIIGCRSLGRTRFHDGTTLREWGESGERKSDPLRKAKATAE